MKELLDTNVIVRFLVGDNEEQQNQAKRWFREGELGKRNIIIHPLTIAESCFVLESVYKKSKPEIADVMEIFLSQRWLRVGERDILVGLWKWYRQGLHFVDSFLLAWVTQEQGRLLSFDKKALRKAGK